MKKGKLIKGIAKIKNNGLGEGSKENIFFEFPTTMKIFNFSQKKKQAWAELSQAQLKWNCFYLDIDYNLFNAMCWFSGNIFLSLSSFLMPSSFLG